jgi:hypothetical protein
MKRLSSVLLLFFVVAQLFLLPALVSGEASPVRPLCPTVTTLPATNVATTTATLNGNVTGFSGFNGATIVPVINGPATPCVVYFQYGTSPGVYTMTTPGKPAPGFGAFHADITGLAACTTFYARAVLSCPDKLPDDASADSPSRAGETLWALAPSHSPNPTLRGLGVGLDPAYAAIETRSCFPAYGREISFKTLGCVVGSGSHQSGGVASTAPSTRPFLMSNIVVQSAALSTGTVSPGQQVDITATLANTGGSNGSARITLYVNGQEADSKGVTVTSGETVPLHFSTSRSEPGTYQVYVNGTSAGSFTVDTFTNNDALIYGIIALFTIGIAGVLFLVFRRRAA